MEKESDTHHNIDSKNVNIPKKKHRSQKQIEWSKKLGQTHFCSFRMGKIFRKNIYRRYRISVKI